MRRVGAAMLVIALGLTGCSGGHRAQPVRVLKHVGPGEGALDLIAWNGDVESGGSDPLVDWVTPFQKATQCKITVKYVSNTAGILSLMSRPDRYYDGAVVPPEIAGKLIATKQAIPVNTSLVKGYSQLDPKLRTQLTHGHTHYGVPFIWGSDLLLYDSNVVRPAPDSWGTLFDPRQAKAYAGHIIDQDSPLSLGTAALYLRAKQPKLHIKDPFELTAKQLAAAAGVLAAQYPYVQAYWLNPADGINDFVGGGAVLGQGTPYHAELLGRAARPISAVAPKEGVTGWMDAWMLGARSQHPNCMYKWLSWISSAKVQSQVSKWNGVAPANTRACTDQRLANLYCGAYHVGDRGYVDKIAFAKTPTADCGSGGHGCTAYDQWTKAWDQARHWVSPQR